MEERTDLLLQKPHLLGSRLLKDSLVVRLGSLPFETAEQGHGPGTESDTGPVVMSSG